jgi:hypothetical protein
LYGCLVQRGADESSGCRNAPRAAYCFFSPPLVLCLLPVATLECSRELCLNTNALFLLIEGIESGAFRQIRRCAWPESAFHDSNTRFSDIKSMRMMNELDLMHSLDVSKAGSGNTV